MTYLIYAFINEYLLYNINLIDDPTACDVVCTVICNRKIRFKQRKTTVRFTLLPSRSSKSFSGLSCDSFLRYAPITELTHFLGISWNRFGYPCQWRGCNTRTREGLLHISTDMCKPTASLSGKRSNEYAQGLLSFTCLYCGRVALYFVTYFLPQCLWDVSHDTRTWQLGNLDAKRWNTNTCYLPM